MTANQLAPNVYWVTPGTGVSNSGIIVGTDGVILFDPKGSVEAAKDVVDKVAGITKLPITTVLISHAHPDHTRGLPGYPAGINIIAQRDDARQMELETFYYTWNANAAGGDAAGGDKPYLPTQVFDDRADLHINGVHILLYHWAPSHTAGDLVAYLPDQKIAFIGDIGAGGGRYENGGSVTGSIAEMKGLLTLDCDTFVGGHAGKPATHADLQTALDNAIAKRDKVVALWNAGKTLEEAEAAMGEKVNPRPAPAIAGLDIYRPGRNMNFTEEVYIDLGADHYFYKPPAAN